MSENVHRAPDGLSTPHVCEGGNLDCGSGLLLLIRRAMNQVPTGEVLEIRSTEISVGEDLPAWCRMTRNPYLGWRPADGHNKYFVKRGGEAAAESDVDDKARDHRWRTRVHWSGGMQARVFCRNHSWTVGQPASFDLKDDAPSAVEYVLGALAACLAMGFRIRASQQGVHIDELEISLNGRIDNIFVFIGGDGGGHSGFSEITGSAYVQAGAPEETLKEIWDATLKASPVANTLLHPASLDISIRAV